MSLFAFLFRGSTGFFLPAFLFSTISFAFFSPSAIVGDFSKVLLPLRASQKFSRFFHSYLNPPISLPNSHLVALCLYLAGLICHPFLIPHEMCHPFLLLKRLLWFLLATLPLLHYIFLFILTLSFNEGLTRFETAFTISTIVVYSSCRVWSSSESTCFS